MSDLAEVPTIDLTRELARRRRRETRACWRCGTAFLAYPTQKWCARRCADAQYYEDHRERRDAARAKARKAARRPAASSEGA